MRYHRHREVNMTQSEITMNGWGVLIVEPLEGWSTVISWWSTVVVGGGLHHQRQKDTVWCLIEDVFAYLFPCSSFHIYTHLCLSRDITVSQCECSGVRRRLYKHRRRKASHWSNLIGLGSVFQQQGDDISVALLSCLVQRGVAHLGKQRGRMDRQNKRCIESRLDGWIITISSYNNHSKRFTPLLIYTHWCTHSYTFFPIHIALDSVWVSHVDWRNWGSNHRPPH